MNQRKPQHHYVIPPQDIAFFKDKIQKSTSFKWNFMMGIVKGLGATIGATLVASILLAFLSQAIKTVYDIPVIGTILENSNIQIPIKEDFQEPEE